MYFYFFKVLVLTQYFPRDTRSLKVYFFFFVLIAIVSFFPLFKVVFSCFHSINLVLFSLHLFRAACSPVVILTIMFILSHALQCKPVIIIIISPAKLQTTKYNSTQT